MTKKESPAGDNRWGKNGMDERKHHGIDTTPHPVAVQGVCAHCPYFFVVNLPSGRLRRLCLFTGEHVPAAGVPLCEFQHAAGGEA